MIPRLDPDTVVAPCVQLLHLSDVELGRAVGALGVVLGDKMGQRGVGTSNIRVSGMNSHTSVSGSCSCRTQHSTSARSQTRASTSRCSQLPETRPSRWRCYGSRCGYGSWCCECCFTWWPLRHCFRWRCWSKCRVNGGQSGFERHGGRDRDCLRRWSNYQRCQY